MMAQNQVQRPALGQWADLGALYDARTDSFVSGSLLTEAVPEAAITVSPNSTTSVKLLLDDRYQAKFDNLKVGTELGASFLSGLISVAGSAEYLKDKRSSDLIEQASIHYSITTVEERLNLASPELRPLLVADAASGLGATHVLVGVVWGAQTVANVRRQLVDENQRGIAEHQMQDIFDRVNIAVQGHGAPTVGSLHWETSMSFNITLFSDVIAEAGHSTDLTEAIDFVLQLPQRTAQINDGKGYPHTYQLIPLQLLSLFGFHASDPCMFSQPRLDCLEEFVAFFDQLSVSGQKINDTFEELGRQTHCVPKSFIDEVARCGRTLGNTETNLRSEFGRLLKDVRSGSGYANQSKLVELLDWARRAVPSGQDVDKMVAQYREKIAFVQKLVDTGVNYLGYGANPVEQELQAYGIQDAYVLFYTEKLRLESKSWDENLKLLQQIFDNKDVDRTVVVVDYDAAGISLDQERLSRFEHGKVTVYDVLEQITNGRCLARYVKDEYLDKSDAKKPLRRSVVKMACPGPNCDKSVAHEWTCHECGVPIEYGAADQFVYCDCGRSPYSNYGFKCKQLEHGNLFERYEKSMLLQLLDSLDPLDELNILIIGETGVGKSTFINAFVNYISYGTLDEAMSQPRLDWVIPCSFSWQDMDRSNPSGTIMRRKIQVGHDEGEADGATGASATQKTTVYPITHNDIVVRLIDTPGIGDTRGVEKDKENMANILAMLSNFDKLHGILFLLKSNSPRLTFMFRFVVEELLTHLHRDAALNMVFGFTNTRGSNYTPGDTLEPLENLLMNHNHQVDMTLSPRTVYCFDSESFRFLAADKEGLRMPNIDDFRRSWKHSEQETKRMVNHFRSLTPHLVRSTLSLNQTRQLILHLTRPMADIMQEIDTTISLNVDNIKDLQDTKLKGENLRGRLHWQKTELESRPLDKPRTVCNDVACKEFHDNGAGVQQVVYKSMCHRECYLTGVPQETLSCPEIMKCAAFRGDQNCHQCSHTWENHLHIQTELEQVQKTVKNEEVVQLLEKNASDIVLKEAAIKNFEQKIKEADYEYTEIQAAAVRFGLFLRKNSITPYNDAMLAYLDHLIKDETDKMQIAGGSRDRLDNLLRHRREHVQQVEVLTKNMDAGSMEDLLDEAGVEALVEHLYRLKHWGQNLRDYKTSAEAAHRDSYREKTYRPQGRSSRSSNVNISASGLSKVAANTVNWLAGRVGTGMVINEKPRRPAVTHPTSSSPPSRRPVTPTTFPSAPNGSTSYLSANAAAVALRPGPKKLQRPPPVPRVPTPVPTDLYPPVMPQKDKSLTKRLLRPFSKRF